MTNHWNDIENSDCVLAMGSNPASNHPISFKYVTKAMEKGAPLISVDPRFTQTSARADIYAPLRSGTDIAFLGGMIKYILDNNLIHEKYVKAYTNASFLVNPDFKMPGENNGVFSGLVESKYDKSTWSYQTDGDGVILKDPTLSDPNCVYRLLKKHYERYTPEVVSNITGTPEDKLLAVYREYAKTGKPGKAGTIMYAMGWTQHTVGVQNIRAMSIIQLLLGNMGVAGGGVNALRGESNVQGSTDMALLFHILPGYLKTPVASWQTLEEYNRKNTPATNEPKSLNWWKNYSKYMASLLRAHYGMNVTLEEAYNYLPKRDDGQDCSWLTLFDSMYKGKFSGLFAWGMNPACSGASSHKVRTALTQLDWMVNVNVYDNETGSFWREPGLDPSKIKTEVFMLPCSAFMEKEGSITNSGRWMQWRYKAVDSPGVAMPDGDIMTELFYRVKERYEKDGGPMSDAITRLTWDYGVKDGTGRVRHFDPDYVAREVNGYFLEDKVIGGVLYKKGTLVPSFGLLQDDGSTSSGNWLYCNSYTEKGNMAKRRGNEDRSLIGLYSDWAWCWPLNRRIIYNGASVDPDTGLPWDKKNPVIRWNGSTWTGDVPDGVAAPGSGRPPFIMKPDGYGNIFGPGLADGPFPEHYEPLECPIEANLLSPQFINPTIVRWDEVGTGTSVDARATCDPRFPFVCSTYRVSEHWQTGVLTRWAPWLAEMQPELFVEIGSELARLKGFKNGEHVMVKSVRGEVEAVAIVTDRYKPMKVAGMTVHQVGIPWHYGWVTTNMRKYVHGDKVPEVFTGGDSANLLTPFIGDPNTGIPESKAFMVNVERKGV
ncbi:MAG: formate dehydrogenase [delta proteobacterium MLS_D]|jgi:formate dehydrogenase major subunit|nr:MAG: formate dehydrogenase [delta proteobacterium MLS_D]